MPGDEELAELTIPEMLEMIRRLTELVELRAMEETE